MTRVRARGFSLVELIISMTIFMVFLAIMFSLTTEMRGHEKRLPVNLMRHPQTNALIARMRKDVLSATRYRDEFQEYTQGPEVLILYSLQESGFGHDVVWDFRKPGIATRRAYSAGGLVSEWTGRGIPKIEIESFEIEDRLPSVRLKGTDEGGKLAIDQILQPRAHR